MSNYRAKLDLRDPLSDESLSFDDIDRLANLVHPTFLKWLHMTFPRRPVSPSDSIEAIMYEAGRQSVVDSIFELYDSAGEFNQ